MVAARVASQADDDELEFLSKVPASGQSVSNSALLRELTWAPERYWAVHARLIENGLLKRGRGRGGSVARVATPSEESAVVIEGVEIAVPVEDDAAITRAEEQAREASLYEPIRSVIAGDWARERGALPDVVAITASQGRRPTGGRWSRPDIVFVAVRTYRHLPGKYLDVVTFEIKAANSVDVTAVYEALSHRRAATHAYALFHVPDEQAAAAGEILDEVCDVARGHGIVVLVAAKPGDYATWDERAPAARVEPDPARMDQFLNVQLEAEDSRRVQLAVR
ncbi:MAG: hypothetical protein ACKVWR_23080 [Acidimicrobiales bacterium]